jgi:hypothetical protein
MLRPIEHQFLLCSLEHAPRIVPLFPQARGKFMRSLLTFPHRVEALEIVHAITEASSIAPTIIPTM